MHRWIRAVFFTPHFCFPIANSFTHAFIFMHIFFTFESIFQMVRFMVC